jgi:predicted ATPase
LEVVLDNKPLNISNVGYGVSQALPVVVELFYRPEETYFAIQQPEVHLHPKAQAAIGELIFHLSNLENKKFIIETHSDFTVDRFRVCVRDSDGKSSSQILYFERCNGFNIATPIEIDHEGNLSPDQPEGFRNFFLSEELRVLGAI